MLQEHLGYLSDQRRLARFGSAIVQSVRPGDLVADVGCGVGILGLMCLRAGARHVWGIDRTHAIDITREVMVRAGLDDRYTTIREHSFRAVLPEKVDVIICDHVGFFGIDYGIIGMIGDARRRLLVPDGKVIPSRIKLVLAGVASDVCAEKTDAWQAVQIPAEYRWLRQNDVNSKHPMELKPEAVATQPADLGMIDLRDDSPEHLAFDATLTATRDCLLNGLAGWFDCELAEGVWMTNSPLAHDRIDRPQAYFPFDVPVQVNRGEAIAVSISIRHDSELIAWSVRVPGTGHRQKQSNWSSLILNGKDLTTRSELVPSLNREGRARQIVLGYANGIRTVSEIEEAVLREHPELFPSADEICRFVRQELARSAE